MPSCCVPFRRRGLLQEARADLGEYRGGIDTSAEGDANRGQYTEWILEKKHPAFLTLHLSALDHIEHETGPFSPEDIAVLESIDATIGKIRATAERLAPGRAHIAVVSDHGFVRTDMQLNLFPLFREAKLITVNEKGKITDWKAIPWVTGGSAAIVLRDPNDTATLSQVRELLDKVASDPANGVDRILDADELHKRGGYPTASFFVGLKPGRQNGIELSMVPFFPKLKSAALTEHCRTCPICTHRSFWLAQEFPRASRLGTIDMRDIAPTLAHEMGLALPSADGKILLAVFVARRASTSWEISLLPPLAQANESFHRIDEFGGVVADAILEDHLDVFNVLDIGRRVALQNDDVGRFAHCKRADFIQLAEKLSAIGRGDVNGFDWREACFDE